jgi:hypothetical protein
MLAALSLWFAKDSVKSILKYVVYAGILLAFLAVPVGSYWMVQRANDNVLTLQLEVANVKSERDEYKNRLAYEEELRKNEAAAAEQHDKQITDIEHFGKRVDDLISSAPKTDSSKVLKDTVKAILDRVKEQSK